MNVRFSRELDGLRLHVVPETDADRVALDEFVKGFPDDSRAARIAVYAESGFGVANSSIAAIGPAAVVFCPPAAKVPHAGAGEEGR